MQGIAGFHSNLAEYHYSKIKAIKKRLGNQSVAWFFISEVSQTYK
tara:strand:+ start:308 stop:442 length:135 start_codon:yes stop_codon:yes gene_type:complete